MKFSVSNAGRALCAVVLGAMLAAAPLTAYAAPSA